MKFKYSICSYSTIHNGYAGVTAESLNTASVLIQPYRLFFYKWILFRLNTASVLIQPELLKQIKKRAMFKYSICSYSTNSTTSYYELPTEFKYSICSYSTKTEAQGMHSVTGLNTASVLIQLEQVIKQWNNRVV